MALDPDGLDVRHAGVGGDVAAGRVGAVQGARDRVALCWTCGLRDGVTCGLREGVTCAVVRAPR
ncbi:hypothetical protein [Streptomyces sp. NPDC093808]|uniref:hypothetical protein n=1 Tax=unclassified Streptomyces TaxID=2593676 RepID=UPI00344F8114